MGYRNGSALFKVTKPYRYHSSKGMITIPAGFTTDGASIPRVFWSILSPYGEYFPAALVHDFLYSPNNIWFNRKESDQLFLEAMYNIGIGWPMRGTIYSAVRSFGWRSFRGNPQS